MAILQIHLSNAPKLIVTGVLTALLSALHHFTQKKIPSAATCPQVTGKRLFQIAIRFTRIHFNRQQSSILKKTEHHCTVILHPRIISAGETAVRACPHVSGHPGS